MLEKLFVIDEISVIRDGSLQIREANLIMEDGKEIAKTYHRHVLHPGADLDGENERVIAVAGVVWTPQVIEDYIAAHPPEPEGPPEDEQ